MTKAQVYASLGPPEWVDKPRTATLSRSRKEILKSNRWIYTEQMVGGFIPERTAYIFKAGKLEDVSR